MPVKKFALLMMLVLCLTALTACGQMAKPLVLPALDSIESIDVIGGGTTVSHADPQWIEDVVNGLLGAKPTAKPSVQDFPLVDEYIQMDIQLKDGTNTLYIYPDGGKYYAERPYQGIYELDAALYELICQPSHKEATYVQNSDY